MWSLCEEGPGYEASVCVCGGGGGGGGGGESQL